MSDLIAMTEVYIIESPSSSDILDGRNEGEALSKILTLFEIKHTVLRVINLESFKKAFDRISEDILPKRKNLGGVHLHFSLHGYKNGIALSDGKMLSWPEFYEVLKKFNDSIDYVTMPSGQKIAPTYLSFSVCEGFNAKTIKEYGEESPYSALIGPIEPILWSDAVLAYSIFFHNLHIKRFGTTKALKNMNTIIGKEIFRVDPGKGMMLKP